MSFATFVTSVDVNSAKIINLADAVSATDAMNKQSTSAAITASVSASRVVASNLTLAAWITSSSYASNLSLYPTGTLLLLPSASSLAKSQYYQNGGSAGTSADWSPLGNAPIALTGTIGDGVSLTFNVSVPTNNVIAVLRNTSTGVFVGANTQVVSNVVTFTFPFGAPTLGQYTYTILYGF